MKEHEGSNSVGGKQTDVNDWQQEECKYKTVASHAVKRSIDSQQKIQVVSFSLHYCYLLSTQPYAPNVFQLRIYNTRCGRVGDSAWNEPLLKLLANMAGSLPEAILDLIVVNQWERKQKFREFLGTEQTCHSYKQLELSEM